MHGMGRHTGPKEKLSRREGVDLGLKGERALNGKSAVARRPYPPGQHGRGRRRDSEYSLRLRAKQRAKRIYGLRERQFARLFARASREPGRAGDNLLRHLELRLDNVVFRLGLAATRAQARQFVVHHHVEVNGRRVDRPSYQLSVGDEVSIRAGSAVAPMVTRASELAGPTPGWLLADPDNLRGQVLRPPGCDEMTEPLDERLIVEHYSR
jgi:small subunit ribosomal protein S4